MLNETLQEPNVTFEVASAVVRDPFILTWIGLTWGVPLIIYLFVGIFVRGRSSNGQATSKPMILYPNFYYAIIIWGLIQLFFLLMLVFPVWLRMFD